MTAKDLTVEEPAPFDSVLEGYAYIPRMLDKARATIAGTNGNYLFGCPVDHTCMARLNISPELVRELAGAHDDDHEVLAALRILGIPSAEEAWFDAVAVEDELQGPGFYLKVREGRIEGTRLTMQLIEAAPGDVEGQHEHPSEELVAVVEGAATYYLGEMQARIVRAGQIVRIPPTIPHRYENRTGAAFRAVSATVT
jgi:quercetin dioxygenase-like cupin family protein